MTHARTTQRPHRFVMGQVYFLLVFLVLFPKGGFKAANVPITWGYLYLLLSAPVVTVVRLLTKPLRWPVTTLAAIGLLVPMQILLVYAYEVGGYQNAGYAVSMIISLVVLPWVFLLVYPAFFNQVNAQGSAKCLRFCMLAAALWGLLLFFTHHITGHYFEIPYLTVNVDDYGLLEITKYNARGLYQKLIATYNNGNLYGVATLILLPMYNVLEPRRWRRGALLAAVMLTLSRTVWVGLVCLELAPLALLLLKQFGSFPVLYLRGARRQILSLTVIVLLILFVLFHATNSGLDFIFDSSLGGRAAELSAVDHNTFLPTLGLIGFDESVYGSAARLYGFTGLVSFLLIMVSPLFVLLLDTSALRSKIRIAAFSGLMLYAVISASDGAFVLIPVMAFYWFTYAVFLYGWPGTQKQPKQREALRAAGVPSPSMLLETT